MGQRFFLTLLEVEVVFFDDDSSLSIEVPSLLFIGISYSIYALPLFLADLDVF